MNITGPTVVVVGHWRDEHSDHLSNALLARGRARVVRWARDAVAADRYVWRGGELRIGRSVVTKGSAAGIWRRPGWPDVSSIDEQYADFAHDEALDSFDGGIQSLGIEWLSTPSALHNAELKQVQLTTAAELGLRIPETVVTNDSTEAQEFARHRDRVVVKPVRYGLVSTSPEPAVAWASAVTSSELEELSTVPVMVQELITAAWHARVVTVDGDAFVARLDAPELDWRSRLENHDAFRRLEGSDADDLAAKAVKMAQALRVRYTSQDWAVDADGHVFLDANPNGQWLFLDHLWDGGVTDALAAKLEQLAGAQPE